MNKIRSQIPKQLKGIKLLLRYEIEYAQGIVGITGERARELAYLAQIIFQMKLLKSVYEY